MNTALSWDWKGSLRAHNRVQSHDIHVTLTLGMWNFIWWVGVSSRPTFGVLIVCMFEGVRLYSVWLDNNVSAILLLPYLNIFTSHPASLFKISWLYHNLWCLSTKAGHIVNILHEHLLIIIHGLGWAMWTGDGNHSKTSLGKATVGLCFSLSVSTIQWLGR